MARRCLTIGLALALAAGIARHQSWADPPPADASAASVAATKSKPARSGVTRADLAAAYLRLEQALLPNPPAADEVARINREFDRATQAFFLGNHSEAIRTIDGLWESLVARQRTPTERALVSLKASVEPPVWIPGQNERADCRVASLYAWPSPEPFDEKLQLRLVSPRGETVVERPCAVKLGGGQAVDVQVALEVADKQLAPGLYRIELAPEDGRPLAVGRVQVVAGPSLDEQRAANESRLARIESTAPEITPALASCRARNQLLSDRPSEENSAQFLADLNALASDVASEIHALESGKNPYFRRAGDSWRVLQVDKREIPLRIYAPQVAAQGTAVPLLVVLHGMGGDENMFLEAYGAGIVKKLADEKGLLVASPLAYRFGNDIGTLHALLDTLSRDYSIDRNRVYALGHSMGASAAAGLARGHGDTIAAACCIAGGQFRFAPDSPPLLVVSPEWDGVVPPKRLQESVQAALAEGMRGELRIMPDYGHTLAVGAVLPEAVEWLLRHRQSSTP